MFKIGPVARKLFKCYTQLVLGPESAPIIPSVISSKPVCLMFNVTHNPRNFCEDTAI